MNKDESLKRTTIKEEPATVPSPASYEEELKDYSKEGEEDATDNLPDSHPEPSPTRQKNN
jgi:hypothetical protein